MPRDAKGKKNRNGQGGSASDKRQVRKPRNQASAARRGGMAKALAGRSGATGKANRTRSATFTNAIEGRHAVNEALAQGVPLTKVFVADERGRRDRRFVELLGRIQAEGIAVEFVSNDYLDCHTLRGSHQGIIAQMAPYQYVSVEDLIVKAEGKDEDLIVVLDHVTDEGNFGAIVRSAEIVGATGVVIPNKRSASVGIGACTTSSGAVFQLPIARVSNLAQAVEKLQQAGYWVFGASEHAQQVVWDVPMHGKVVLVMGSEGSGISQHILSKCDFLCKLPQVGHIESLNVAQATTVMCFEWLRRCRESQVR